MSTDPPKAHIQPEAQQDFCHCDTTYKLLADSPLRGTAQSQRRHISAENF